MSAPFTSFPIPTTTVLDWGLPVNVKDFGAAGDGVTDDTLAIQAAIDYAIANNFRAVFMPDGTYRTTATIFLDHPASLRGIGVLPAWSSGVTYASGNQVTNGGMVWTSLVNGNLGNAPTLNGPNFTANGAWTLANGLAPVTGQFVFWQVSFSTPAHFETSLALVGPPGLGRGDVKTRIITNFNNAPALIMGAGNGIYVSGIGIAACFGAQGNATDGGTCNSNVYGPAWRYLNGNPSMGYGIALAGTGGSERMFIDKCFVSGMRNGVTTGYCGDGLGDWNTIKDSYIIAGIGVTVKQTQNFINSIEDCLIAARVAVQAISGQGVQCIGGNYSTLNEQTPSCSFPVSTITNVSSTQFTAVVNVSSPSVAFFDGVSLTSFFQTGQLGTFIALTTHFGPVPFTPVAYNSGTNVVTFNLNSDWSAYTGLDLSATYDVMTEVAACTKFFASDAATVFVGSPIQAANLHVENICPTVFFDTTATFSAFRPSSARGIIFNGNGGYSAYQNTPSNDAWYAWWLTQFIIPFIKIGTANLLMDGCQIGLSGQPPMNLDCANPGASSLFQMRGCVGFRFNSRMALVAGSNRNFNYPGYGVGDFDVSPYIPQQTLSTSLFADGLIPPNYRTPFHGFIPAISQDMAFDYTNYLSAPANLLPNPLGLNVGTGAWNFNYVPLFGGFIYNQDTAFGTLHHRFMSNHGNGASYGQSLPVNWNAKGQSQFLYVDDVSLFFPGLGITITTDTTYDLIVTGVYAEWLQGYPAVNKTPGFVQVVRDTFHIPPITGTHSTVYTGTSITQKPYDMRYFDDLDTSVVAVASLPAPSAGNQGARRFVNNSTVVASGNFGAVVAGGGANTVPVFSDGTNWRIG